MDIGEKIKAYADSKTQLPPTFVDSFQAELEEERYWRLMTYRAALTNDRALAQTLVCLREMGATIRCEDAAIVIQCHRSFFWRDLDIGLALEEPDTADTTTS